MAYTAAERMVLSETEAVDLVAFLVTAARALLDEPVDYGPMRLLSAAERLSGSAAPRCSSEAHALLSGVAEQVPRALPERLRDPEGYRAVLDELCVALARGLARRAGREVSG